MDPKPTIIIIGLCILTACDGEEYSAPVRRVDTIDTRARVEQMLGEPYLIITSIDGSERWFYHRATFAAQQTFNELLIVDIDASGVVQRIGKGDL